MGDSVERVTMRRVRLRLLRLVFLIYIASYLDRSNVGIAALQMNSDLGFGPAIFGFGAGIFYLGYAAFEVPSNLVLVHVGARRWIARIAITLWRVLPLAPAGRYGGSTHDRRKYGRRPGAVDLEWFISAPEVAAQGPRWGLPASEVA